MSYVFFQCLCGLVFGFFSLYALYEFLEDPLFTQYNYKHEHTELYEEYPELEEIVNNEVFRQASVKKKKSKEVNDEI